MDMTNQLALGIPATALATLHVAIDTETTGTDPRKDRIVEVAAVRFDAATGVVVDRFQAYVNPGIEVPQDAVEIHGLTTEFLADKPAFKEVAAEFLAFCAGAQGVAHNAPFDSRFLEAELKRAKAPRLSATLSTLEDTLALSRHVVRSRKHSLDVLCDRYGVDRGQRTSHGALLDCELLAAVYPHIKQAYAVLSQGLSAFTTLPIGTPLPEEIADCVAHVLEIKALVSFLEKEIDRVSLPLKSVLAGQSQTGDGWEISFSSIAPTDWKKLVEDNLAGALKGVDLEAYKGKETTRMAIKHTD